MSNLKCHIFSMVLTFHWLWMCWNTYILKTSLFRICYLSQIDSPNLSSVLFACRSWTSDHFSVTAWNAFFIAFKFGGHWLNGMILHRPRTLSASGAERAVRGPLLASTVEDQLIGWIPVWLTVILNHTVKYFLPQVQSAWKTRDKVHLFISTSFILLHIVNKTFNVYYSIL